ncbi:hypothetical protein [Glaciecola sp. 1036]|uniref:hypothetical protein n=1 Tax=Alteromonadaceae TaxID=72275 RepID=UPI003CFF98E5
MILLTSGAYISQEFASEVGLLPPAFLPIANKRLYELQADLIASSKSNKYISLPKDYVVPDADVSELENLDISILRVPSKISLGESILYSWNSTGKSHDTLTILHGDTLFSQDFDFNHHPPDSISVHKNTGSYIRAKLANGSDISAKFKNVRASDSDLVVSGFFSFSEPHLLMKGILENNGNFIKALEYYNSFRTLTLISKGDWFDFGHLNSFFRSRSEMTTQRAFNEMKITSLVVDKRSSNSKKMYAESSWFEALPKYLKLHTPQFLGEIKENNEYCGYQLEFLYLLPLNDLFVFGQLADGDWRQIFSAAANILDQFKSYKPSGEELDKVVSISNLIYMDKTKKRLAQFAEMENFDLDEKFGLVCKPNVKVSLNEIMHESSKYITEITQEKVGIIHGDFCFSNILYDSRARRLKLIDPRGMDSNSQFTIYGDTRYDIAKLYHSVFGGYDLIISGRFQNSFDKQTKQYTFKLLTNENQSQVEKLFNEIFLINADNRHKEILSITIHLFLSMLPLHFDYKERQQAMIANALRLYFKLQEL